MNILSRDNGHRAGEESGIFCSDRISLRDPEILFWRHSEQEIKSLPFLRLRTDTKGDFKKIAKVKRVWFQE